MNLSELKKKLCCFSAHMHDRFDELQLSHPGMYKLLDVASNNGYTMREAIQWINEHSDKHIKC